MVGETELKGLCSGCNRAVALDAETCPYCNALLSTKRVGPDTPGAQAEKTPEL
jgi:predicted amidophosphoribosyltransferase